MNIVKLMCCAIVGAGVACLGAVMSPGVAGVAWLGLLLGVMVVALGSVLSAELAGLLGGLIYAGSAFGLTLCFSLFPPSIDMLALPADLPAEFGDQPATHIWPLLLLVAALIPLWVKFPESAPSSGVNNAASAPTSATSAQ